MVSPRLQEYSRSRSSTHTSRSSSYASARANSGYESELDESSGYSPGLRRPAPQWKEKNPYSGRTRRTMTSGVAIEEEELMQGDPVSGLHCSNNTDAWYSHLRPEDELSEPSDRRSRSIAPSLRGSAVQETDDEMIPETLDDSQTAKSIHEAMQRLTTTDREPEGSGRSHSKSPFLDDVTMEGPDRDAQFIYGDSRAHGGVNAGLQPVNNPSSNSVRGEAGAQETVGLEEPGAGTFRVLDHRLADIHSGITTMNLRLEEKYNSITDRLEKLEQRTHPATVVLTRTQRRNGPYTIPKRRPISAKKLAVGPNVSTRPLETLTSVDKRHVRNHMDKLLDHHDAPFATESEAEEFARIVKTEPEKRSCNVNQFKIDLHGGSRSPFNLSSALVFTEDYLFENNLSNRDAEAITNAFLTRIKSIKQSFMQNETQKASKASYVRKYNLYHRRLEAIAGHPLLQAHLPLLQALSVEGMSSDEEDSEPLTGTTNRAGRGRQTWALTKNPIYHVLTPQWRSQELSIFLHVLDSVYAMQRRLDPDRQRGNWPRPRTYNPGSLRLSKKATFPKNLPKNAYSPKFLERFQNVALSVNPASPYDFTHSPEVFHYLLSDTSREGV